MGNEMKIYKVLELYYVEGEKYPREEVIGEYDNLRSALIKRGYRDYYNEYGYIKFEVVEVEVENSALVVGFPQFDNLMKCSDEELQELYKQQIIHS
jgi:hypothetical protein